MTEPAGLSPLQARTLAALRLGEQPVVFDAEFVDDLCAGVDAAFADFHERLADTTLFVNKHRLATVLGCEVQHMLDDSFEWSPSRAVGRVAHRAIELMINWRGDPIPRHLVDEALARLADDESDFGDWIAGCSDADTADLRGRATDKVTKFQECFPPLPGRFAPRTESSIRWPNEGPIMLSGKVDLAIGRPVGTESRKVIVDLKTGWVSSQHREDLRFYALVDTLRSRVPPRKLASFYLDSGEPVAEDVTENVLRAATRRMLDAVNAEIELRVEGREPVKRPGASCRWCPLMRECAEGRAHLANSGDEL